MSDPDNHTHQIQQLEKQVTALRQRLDETETLLGRTMVTTTVVAKTVLRVGRRVASLTPTSEGENIRVWLDLLEQQVEQLRATAEALEDQSRHE